MRYISNALPPTLVIRQSNSGDTLPSDNDQHHLAFSSAYPRRDRL